MRLQVGGARGVGKSTVTCLLSKRLDEEGIGIKVIHTTQTFVEHVIKNNLNLSELNLQERTRMKREIFLKQMKFNNVLLDGHYSDLVDNKYVSALSPDLWSMLDVHVLMEIPIKELYLRRKADLSKTRVTAIEFIEAEVKAERLFAEKVCDDNKKELITITNINITDSVIKLQDILKQLMRR